MSSKVTPSKPFVLMMYGFPGSGKTSFSRQMSEELGIIHLQEDKIRHDLFGNNDSPGAHKATRKVMDFMTRDYLKAGISLMYDAHVIRAIDRRKVREMAHEAKAVSLLIWLQVDPEATFERTQKRDRRKADDKYAQEYDEETYRYILGQMQNPNNEDYIVVSGKHTFSTQHSSVIKRLFDMRVLTAKDASANVVKPELMNLVPKSNIQMRGDIIHRNISIR
jgi:predicted kinase